jgi:hypothetical protein
LVHEIGANPKPLQRAQYAENSLQQGERRNDPHAKGWVCHVIVPYIFTQPRTMG